MRRHSFCSLMVLPVALLISDTATAQNFTGSDASIVARAEQARHDSAIYWSGAKLPGRWSAPCPIVVTPADHAGGGSTTFTFAGGEVFGWRMQVSGRQDAILSDVVPHEVDHMVRASLVRRPIPRWLDEGCASDRESAASQQRLRDEAHRLFESGTFMTIDNAWLDAQDYPHNGEETAAMYAVGHSLVEFLTDHGGPRRLLEFQCDPRPPSEKLEEFYDVPTGEVVSELRRWLQLRIPSVEVSSNGISHTAECPLLSLGRPCDYAGPDLLTVYTSFSCGPCRQFWCDLQNDAEFRDAIRARFHLHRLDVDLQPMLARQAAVDTVPTFVTRQGRVIGYLGKAWLLERLDALLPAATEEIAIDLADAASTNPETTPDSAIEEGVSGLQSATPKSAAPSAIDTLPIAFTLLEWLGIIGGSAATGGIGTFAIWGVLRLLQRRRQRRSLDVTNHTVVNTSNSTVTPADDGASSSNQEVTLRAPFPRKLDEACELLALGRAEGRVAVLDTLRGMFLDDELDKLASAGQDQSAWSKQLKDAIDARVEEVAPISVEID